METSSEAPQAVRVLLSPLARRRLLPRLYRPLPGLLDGLGALLVEGASRLRLLLSGRRLVRIT